MPLRLPGESVLMMKKVMLASAAPSLLFALPVLAARARESSSDYPEVRMCWDK